jgi:hypothetical protein
MHSSAQADPDGFGEYSFLVAAILERRADVARDLEYA